MVAMSVVESQWGRRQAASLAQAQQQDPWSCTCTALAACKVLDLGSPDCMQP